MKIVIVGNGKVGFSLAEQLVREKYDVVIVDLREDTLRRAADALDIMSVKGNGISAATLIEAGAPDADLLVAANNLSGAFSWTTAFNIFQHRIITGGARNRYII